MKGEILVHFLGKKIYSKLCALKQSTTDKFENALVVSDTISVAASAE